MDAATMMVLNSGGSGGKLEGVAALIAIAPLIMVLGMIFAITYTFLCKSEKNPPTEDIRKEE